MSDLKFGDRVSPTAGPWAGAHGTVHELRGRLVVVAIDYDARRENGAGATGVFDPRWLRRIDGA